MRIIRDDNGNPSATWLKERASWLKGQRKYYHALRLRLRLEKLLDQSGAAVTDRTTNLNWIAFLGYHSRRLDEAERAARKCVELYKPAAKDSDDRLATYLSMLAAVLAENRKFQEAVLYKEEAVAIASRNRGDDDFVKSHRKRLERMRNRDTRPYLDP